MNRRLLASGCVFSFTALLYEQNRCWHYVAFIVLILFYIHVLYVIAFTHFTIYIYLFFSFFSLSPLHQLLAKIYKMPLKPIFLSGRLVNLPRRVQEQSASSEDGIECILSDFDDDTGKCTESSKCRINQLLLPHVTVNFANC